MIGCSHHRTPVAIREKLAFMPDQISDALRGMRQRWPDTEFALLSTCNRVELYAAASDRAADLDPAQLQDFLISYHRLDAETFREHLVVRQNRVAVEHLFTVACALDSLVIGEAQIISQVKDAYEAAQHVGSAGAILHALFQRASHVAKRVAKETAVHAKRISVPSVAISEVAREFFERFDDKHLLVIGSGEMGRETIRYLADAKATRIHLINRSLDRARALAAEYMADTDGRTKIEPVDWSSLHTQLQLADLIVSTTSATEPIVDATTYAAILQRRRRPTPQLILDLAVPRDFDTAIDDLSGVYVYSVDDLQQVCQRNLRHRQEQFPAAQAIIAEETESFFAQTKFWQAIPTIQQLRNQGDSIKSAELQRLQNRLKHMTDPAAVEAEVAAAMDRVVNKLLNSPLQVLRQESHQNSNQELLLALRRLFSLDENNA